MTLRGRKWNDAPVKVANYEQRSDRDILKPSWKSNTEGGQRLHGNPLRLAIPFESSDTVSELGRPRSQRARDLGRVVSHLSGI